MNWNSAGEAVNCVAIPLYSFELALKPACIAVLILSSAISAAQDDSLRLAPIVVTPTRVEQSSFDLPVSIDAFNKEQIQQVQSQVNLSETLIRALYANAGKGFETPTFAELAYKSVSATSTGFNFALKAAESNNYEIGAKTYLGSNTRLNAAVFKTDTKNEIIVLINNAGRSVFQNVDSTSRKGFELAVDIKFGNGFTGLLAYTYLDAKFENAFLTCGTSAACVAPSLNVPAGNKIPGVPANSVYGELGWSYNPFGFSTAMEARWVDKVFTNDLNAESAPGRSDRLADAYTIVDWRVAFEQKLGSWKLDEFARVDNIFDEQYVGSVIVNASNGQYYERRPGPTTSWAYR